MRNNQESSKLRVTWVIPTLGAGGIGPACRYAAEGVAKLAGCQATVVTLHEPPAAYTDAATGVDYIALGLTDDAPQGFLRWLQANPQDVVITNDVSRIEVSFPFWPASVIHIVQIHDSGASYQDVAVRYSPFIDGVSCVGHHIETQLSKKLTEVGFQGLLGTVHNGASFPPIPTRDISPGPLQLLFMGRLDPLIKGIYDLVPILDHTIKAEVPARLVIAGGYDDGLAVRFKQKKLDHYVTWLGRVPHQECYQLAAQSDIFLMTSRREPFGMVTIEAMSMGCVPLAYDIPSGSREIIEPNKNGFLLPLGDFEVWAATIKSLHNNRGRLHQLSSQAMGRAREDFNNDQQAARLVDFIRKVKTNSRRRPPERKPGYPPVSQTANHQSIYHKLPVRFRKWARDSIGRHPRLSFWLINR